MSCIVEISEEKFINCFKIFSIHDNRIRKTFYKLVCVDNKLKEFIINGASSLTKVKIEFSIEEYEKMDCFSICEKRLPPNIINDGRFFEFETEDEAFYFKLKFC